MVNARRIAEASRRLNASLASADESRALEPSFVREPTSLFNSLVTDSELRRKTEVLFTNGHHAEAVEKAFKLVVKVVKEKSELTEIDGSALMQKAFSPKSPVLKLNSLGSDAERDEQSGYKDIFAGSATGIRNPRAHEPDWEDTEQRALELLTLANHLIVRARAAEKSNQITP